MTGGGLSSALPRLVAVLVGVALLASGCGGADSGAERPQAGAWKAIPAGPQTAPRIGPAAFSSGTDVVFVGNGTATMYGAAFDLERNRWRPTSDGPLPSRDGYAAAWTGEEVIVWGGANEEGELADGAAFSPTEGRWRTIAPAPLKARGAATVVWTGEEMIVVGGGTAESVFFADGAAYDPSSDSWREIPRFPVEARFGAVGVWTGTEIVVWGGVVASLPLPSDGAAYDPKTNEWRRIAASPLSGRMDFTAVWTGREVLIWGGTQNPPQLDDGAAYDPAKDSCRRLPPAPIRGRYDHSAVWSGDRMIVWGGARGTPGDAPPPVLADGASFDPATGVWTSLPPSPVAGRYGHGAAWSGQEMIVWGGCCTNPADAQSFSDGGRYRP